MSTILQVKDLKITFPVDGEDAAAVDGISFSLEQGKVLGIVGESGCGKTVTALSLLRLIESPGKIAEGKAFYYGNIPGVSPPSAKQDPGDDKIETKSQKVENSPAAGSEEDLTPVYEQDFAGPNDLTASVLTRHHEPEGGIDLFQLSEEDIRKVRGNKIAMVFQEPMTSLNPVFTVGDQVMEAIILHQHLDKKEAKEVAIDMLRRVHIPDPEKRIEDYPHQMSGGMRQRVMIAMALSCKPDILIADEPTTALDVTIQAQIIDLFQELIDEMHMSVLLITHDLGVVAQICDDVLVMYAGMVAEQAPVKRLFRRPKHPYTLGLLKSIPPLFGGEGEDLYTIPGTVPPLGQMPEGCRFADRCPRAKVACTRNVPKFKYVGEGQNLRCINY
jgi:peptide/nickel transport system ATP-binding protein